MWRFKFHPFWRHPYFWRLLSGCNVALSACENSSQWEMGLSLLFGGTGGIQCDTALRCNSKHFLRSVGGFNVCFLFIIWIIIPDDMKWLGKTCVKWMQMGWNHQPVAAFGSIFVVGMMPRVSFSRIQGSTPFNCKSLISYTILHSKIFWLVVSNIFIFHIYWE